MKLVIPGRLPGLNEFIENDRRSRQAGNRLKQDAQTTVMWCIRKDLKNWKPKLPVTVRYTWVEPNKKRDKDNISSFGRKVIQDALVEMHILPNDGWGEIESFSDNFAIDAKNPRIEVEIVESQ